MLRLRAVFFIIAVGASSCTSTAVVNEVGSTTGPSTASPVEEVALAVETMVATPDPLATVAPLPTLTPTPVPPKWVVVSEDSESVENTDEEGGVSVTTEAQEPENASTEAQPTMTPTPATEPVTATASQFRVGTCYTEQGWNTETSTPCSKPHQLQVILAGTFNDPPGTSYPGVDRLRDRVDQECDRMLLPLGLISGSDIVTASSAPREPGWDAGIRTWACLLVGPFTLESIVADRDSAAQQSAFDDAAADEADAQAQAARTLNVGDCVAPDNQTKVSCSGSHAFEVFARTNLASAGGVYPGVDFIDQQGAEFCRREHEELGLVGSIVGLYPNRTTWEQLDDHSLVCLLDLNS